MLYFSSNLVCNQLQARIQIQLTTTALNQVSALHFSIFDSLFESDVH